MFYILTTLIFNTCIEHNHRITMLCNIMHHFWHTRHILPPSEIKIGLCLVVFAGSEGRYLFHRIG